MHTGSGTVVDINPTSSAVYALDEIPSGTGGGSTQATAFRYDLATHHVVFGATIVNPGTLTVTGGWAWVVADDGEGDANTPVNTETVYKLDPSTLAVVGTTMLSVATNDMPSYLPDPTLTATVNGPIWVAAGFTLYALSSATGRVVAKAPVAMDVTSLSTSPDGSVLYAVGNGDVENEPLVIDELDGHTGRLLVHTTDNDGVGGGQAAAAAAGVWVSFRTGMNGVTVLYRKATLALTTAPGQGFPSPFDQGMGEQADVSGGALWIAGLEGLACADPATGTLRASEPMMIGGAQNEINAVVAGGGVLYGAGTDPSGLQIVDPPRACFS